jgi:hypothetical protein
MSIYDKSSLVLIPSGTKTGKVFSQKPVSGDGDFTFTRASAATRVNADGNIEKETQNLLLQSNDFGTASWSGSVTITSGQAGYDGSNDAWLIQNAAPSAYVRQESSLSGVLTASIYAKAGNANWMRFAVSNSPIVSVYFDLVNGTGHGISNVISHKIEDVGSGWHRYSVTFLASSMGGMQWYPADANNDLGETGDNILIQDAQLEQGLVARDYIETTTAAVYGGITDNTPRLDYTDSSCPALLLEPLRTNAVSQSEYFGAWTPNGLTIIDNDATSPEGVSNAAKLTLPSGSATKRIALGSMPVTSVARSYSFFVKSDDITAVQLVHSGDLQGYARFNVSTGVVGSTGTKTTSDIEDYGNGWYRIIANFDSTNAYGSTIYLYINDDASGGYGGSTSAQGDLFVYGAQYEEGSYATSYIPTYGSSVSRVEDTYKKLGFGNTSTEGTFFAEFEVKKIESANGQYMYGLGVGTTDLGGFYAAASGALSIISNGSKIQCYNNGYATSLFSFTPLIGDIVKIAIRYDGTNVVGFVNGVKQTIKTDNVTGVKNTIRVNHGEQSSHATKQLLYIPTALTDQEAIDLTTI